MNFLLGAVGRTPFFIWLPKDHALALEQANDCSQALGEEAQAGGLHFRAACHIEGRRAWGFELQGRGQG